MYAAIIFVCTLLSVYGFAPSVFAESLSADAPNSPSGLVTGINGRVMALTTDSDQIRELHVGDRVRSGDELRAGPGSTIEVLWNKRALLSLRDLTVVRMTEPKGGQTLVQVLAGHARIAYSYNEGHSTDTLAVMTPDARAVMRGGILEAIVQQGRQPHDQHLTKFEQKEESAKVSSSGDMIRIVEGQARVEPVSSSTKSILLKAGHEIRVSSKGADDPREHTGSLQPRLAAIANHEAVPQVAVQRIAGIHVDHALELEQSLRKGAEDAKNPQNQESGVKGAILPTSLGIPVTPFQTASGSPTTAATPASPALVVSPTIGAGSGPTAGSAPAVSALSVPVQVTVPVPSASTFVPSQSGGLNSVTLLQQVLRDALANPGKGQGKGKGKD